MANSPIQTLIADWELARRVLSGLVSGKGAENQLPGLLVASPLSLLSSQPKVWIFYLSTIVYLENIGDAEFENLPQILDDLQRNQTSNHLKEIQDYIQQISALPEDHIVSAGREIAQNLDVEGILQTTEFIVNMPWDWCRAYCGDDIDCLQECLQKSAN